MGITDLYSIANTCSMPKIIRDAFEELINQGVPFNLYLDKDPWKDPLMGEKRLVFYLGKHDKIVSLRNVTKDIEYYDFLKECLQAITDSGYVYNLKGIISSIPAITPVTTKVPTITGYIPTDIDITSLETHIVTPTYNADVEKFLDIVKTELESRGDFTIDVSKLVDLLFKLGVVISKGD